jgi:glycosyltransferase involved in cell wall biosynthesis
MVPDLLRLRASHLELPPFDHPVRLRYTLPRRLAATLRDLDVTVIQAVSPATALVARQVARRLELRWIATLYRPFSTKGLMARLIERRQAYADALIAVSDHVARDALAHFPDLGERLHTIPPGINFDRFDPALVRADRVIRLAGELRVPDGSHLVLCPTRFVEDGGQKILIEAIKKLARSDVFCLLLGSSGAPTSFERELEHAIERAELQGRVQIGPYVEDMPAAYMLADVVVATGGANRGFSRTLVEAQAMGRPVVAEDAGGAAEAVLPDVTGWPSATGDAAALAAAISQAISLSVERRAELARAAQDHVRGRFALKSANRQLVQLYERLSA